MLPTVTLELPKVVVPRMFRLVVALPSIAPKVSVEVALAPVAVSAVERVTTVPVMLATVVPVATPKPVTLMPAKMPEAFAAETVTVVAAAVIAVADWVTPKGAGLKVTFDVARAEAPVAVDRVSTLPAMLAIVVPCVMFAPFTYIPGRRPVEERTVMLVLALGTLAISEVIAAPAAGPKTNVLVPPKVGAADSVMSVPTTLVTVVLGASVPVPPAARLTVAPGMMDVPAGTVKVAAAVKT